MKRTPFANIFVLIAFLVNTLGYLPVAQAQDSPAIGGDFQLPVPGVMVHLSPTFNPPILKGIKVNPKNPFRFEFILDPGDAVLAKNENSKLIKYFLASLTTPEKDLWVNLSPYEKERIVPQSFGQTEMGRDLLAEDYILKQITASLIYPEGQIGKRFWRRVYEQAAKKFGTTDISVKTFNKVWILPEKAVVYENAKAGTAYVVESKLKVMLEEDYLALSKHQGQAKEQANDLGSQVVREIVIPQLTKEVNTGKNFAQLRQVYNSLILATWYKKKIKDSILAQVYADKNKIKGVEYNKSIITQTPNNDVDLIYQRYLQAFKKGVFNYIKEDSIDSSIQATPRKYFSGGEELINVDKAMTFTAYPPRDQGRKLKLISVDLAMSMGPADNAMFISGNVFHKDFRPFIKWVQRLPDALEMAQTSNRLKSIFRGQWLRSTPLGKTTFQDPDPWLVFMKEFNRGSVYKDVPLWLKNMLDKNGYRYLTKKSADKLLKQVRLFHASSLSSIPYSLMALSGDLAYFREFRNEKHKIAKVVFFTESVASILELTEFFFVDGEYYGYGHGQLIYPDAISMKNPENLNNIRLLFNVFQNHRGEKGLASYIFNERMKEYASLIPKNRQQGGLFQINANQFSQSVRALPFYAGLGFEARDPNLIHETNSRFKKLMAAYLKDLKRGVISEANFEFIKKQKYAPLFQSVLVRPLVENLGLSFPGKVRSKDSAMSVSGQGSIQRRIALLEEWINSTIKGNSKDQIIEIKVSRDEDLMSRVYDTLNTLKGNGSEVIKINLSELSGSQKETYEFLYGSFRDVSLFLASSGKYDAADKGFFIFELLKNAFVYGNHLNWELPIYVKLDNSRNKVNVFDLNLNSLGLVPNKERMNRSEGILYGKKKAISSIESSGARYTNGNVVSGSEIVGHSARIDFAMRADERKIDLKSRKIYGIALHEDGSLVQQEISENDWPKNAVDIMPGKSGVLDLRNSPGPIEFLLDLCTALLVVTPDHLSFAHSDFNDFKTLREVIRNIPQGQKDAKVLLLGGTNYQFYDSQLEQRRIAEIEDDRLRILQAVQDKKIKPKFFWPGFYGAPIRVAFDPRTKMLYVDTRDDPFGKKLQALRNLSKRQGAGDQAMSAGNEDLVKVKRKVYQTGFGNTRTQYTIIDDGVIVGGYGEPGDRDRSKEIKDQYLAVKKKKKDGAMTSTGGIDLTVANINLQTMTDSSLGPKSEMMGIKFYLDPAMFAQLQNAAGFVPVIISVVPLKDLNLFLTAA